MCDQLRIGYAGHSFLLPFRSPGVRWFGPQFNLSMRGVALHRRIGLIGFVLAVLMIALGVLTASDR